MRGRTGTTDRRPAGHWTAWKVLALLLVGLAAAAPKVGEKDAGQPPEAGAARAARQGHWIRIPLPIDNATATRVKQSIARSLDTAQDARPVFVLEFDAPAGAADAGRGTQFDDAHRLARYLVGEDLNAATTVAYVPKSLKGHAVLVALACDQIIMGPAATIGDAGIDEPAVNNTMFAAYQEIPRSRHTVPTEVALGMLDKAREVIRVRTEVSTEYVTPVGLNDLGRDHRVVSQERIKPAGESWQFTGAEGRKWGFIDFLAEDRRDVVRAMELSLAVLDGDPSADGGWRAVRLDLKGTITAEKVSQIQRLVDEEMRKGTNFICLWIESPGGRPSPDDSMQLATYLADLDRNRVRTVAYVPTEARADAVIVAMACDQVVVRPKTVLGGPGAYQMTEEEIARYRQTLRDSLARQKLRSWSLWAAMIDPELDVFRCTRLGQVEYFSDDELKNQQPKRDQGEKGPLWEKHQRVTIPGKVLQLTGDQAGEYHLAAAVVENFAQFKQHYGMENDPMLVEAGWADHMVEFLRSPQIAVLLLVVGGLALYIELHAPGLGIGGFVATVCFALFFWSRYLEGTATWLEVTLFLTGVLCLLLEVFVLPGFGIFGLGGGALILISVILASQTSWLPRNEYQLAQLERSLLMVASAIGGVIVAAVLLRRWLPQAPVLQNVFLPPPEGEEAELISRREMLVNLDNLLGMVGVAATSLAPGGKARFGNHLVDVMADGDFVPRDTPIVVAEVHGNRVVVRAVTQG